MDQKISNDYLLKEFRLRPGDRLHRLFAILGDTYYDDLTDARIIQLEELAQSWRWMNASGQRVD